ncbi:GNAT family N-acetyltransferase [Polymorphospora lycopeni]|uniref:GNAT family N-acetyltransferase n=1 Tax=Polymorphospora lycopeni TaxID=3140240 RepID=A0ABV5D1X2_9ACTN
MTVLAVDPGQPPFDRVAELFDAYRVHYGLPAAPAATRRWLAEQLTAGRLQVAAGVRDGRAHGFVTRTVLPASLLLGTAWMIRDLYVDPAHRRSGLARELLRHVVDEARAAGALRISLQTEPDNAAALRLYAGFGFRAVDGLKSLSLPLTPA